MDLSLTSTISLTPKPGAAKFLFEIATERLEIDLMHHWELIVGCAIE